MWLIEHKAFASLFLFLVSFGSFAFSLKNDFVWDDVQVIEKSYYSFKASRIKSIVIPKIKKGKNVAPYYHPVIFISIVLDRSLWGISPFGFHLSNVVVNSVSTVVFYLLVLFVLGEFGVTQRENKAFLSSLLFALDPMHVESVSWVAGRTGEDASTKTTNYAIPHSNYGMALKDAGKQDEAIRELLTALDPEVKNTDRGRAATANNLGLVYLDKEDYKNAEEWFLKALYYDSKYGRTYYHLGLIYFIKGEYGNSVFDYRMAEKYLKKTLEMYRSYGRANLLLAKVYIRLGEREKARENAERAIRSGLIEPLSIEAQGILNELKDK